MNNFRNMMLCAAAFALFLTLPLIAMGDMPAMPDPPKRGCGSLGFAEFTVFSVIGLAYVGLRRIPKE